jgi:hypothetical protein
MRPIIIGLMRCAKRCRLTYGMFADYDIRARYRILRSTVLCVCVDVSAIARHIVATLGLGSTVQ